MCRSLHHWRRIVVPFLLKIYIWCLCHWNQPRQHYWKYQFIVTYQPYLSNWEFQLLQQHHYYLVSIWDDKLHLIFQKEGTLVRIKLLKGEKVKAFMLLSFYDIVGNKDNTVCLFVENGNVCLKVYNLWTNPFLCLIGSTAKQHLRLEG